MSWDGNLSSCGNCQVVMCWICRGRVHTLTRNNSNTRSPTLQFHKQTNIHTLLFTFFLFDVHCSKSGSRPLSVYSDWSQCECLVFRQWLCSQNVDFHSCCLLMGFFPLSHLNWLLLSPKLAVTFCIFVLGFSEPVYLGVIVQFGKLKRQWQKEFSLTKVYLWFMFR